MSAADVWTEVREQLVDLPAGARIVLHKDVPHPQLGGARRDIGLPAGQLADWRFAPGPDCTGVHVHEFADRYVAHLDRVHPACSIVGHVRSDAPQLLVGLGILGGAAVGARSGGVGGLLLGALAGAALGAALRG